MKKDYYQILGVPKNASDNDIKKAYRKLAMQYHPDRNQGKEEWANQKFKEINEAFSVLGDPDKRKRFDRFGAVDGINIGDVYSNPFTKGTFDDLMKDFGGAGLGFDFLENIFGGIFGGARGGVKGFRGPVNIRFQTRGGPINLNDIMGQAQSKRQQSKPVTYEINISAEDAKKGIKKVLTRKGKRLEVKIPPNVKTGSKVKLSNALQKTDGRPGDIMIQIKVDPKDK